MGRLFSQTLVSLKRYPDTQLIFVRHWQAGETQRPKPISNHASTAAEAVTAAVVPPELESSPQLYPALKRWATFGCPSGAGFSYFSSTGPA
jgi:hypothetical protein